MATAPLSPKIKIVWAHDLNGKSPAKTFFDALDDAHRRKFQHSIDRLEAGDTRLTREQFKSLGDGLYEFKEHQARLLGGFQNGAFVLATGLWKKKDEMPKEAMLAARRILKENEITVASTTLIRIATPTPSPVFRPVLVPPPVARPLMPEPEPAKRSIFKPCDQEYGWAFVKKADQLPAHAPLMQSMVRLPHLHTMMLEEQVEPYIRQRLSALSKDVRMALGLLSDDVIVGLKLAFIWGIEATTAYELEQTEEAEASVPVVEPPPAELVPEPEPEPPAQEVKFYWLQIGRKRWIAEIVGQARRYGTGTPKVKMRAYQAGPKRWGKVVRKPAHLFKDLVSMRDPRAQEALAKREDV